MNTKIILWLGPTAILVVVIASIYILNATLTRRAPQPPQAQQGIQQASPPLLQPNRPIVQLPPESAKLVDSEGWLTYKSNSKRISLKYPPTWTVHEPLNDPLDPFVYLSAPAAPNREKNEQVTVRTYPKSGDMPFTVWLDRHISDEPPTGSPVTKTPVKIGANTAWHVTGLPTGPLGGLSYFFETEDEFVSLGAGPYFPNKCSSTDAECRNKHQELRSLAETMIATLTSR